MIAAMDLASCPDLAVPAEVMRHVVAVESSRNPFAIGVVGRQLERQPRNLDEAVATARMLEQGGYNYSLGVAQINRVNFAKYGIDSYEKAFDYCSNLSAGARILSECHGRAGGDWGKAFSCYYSGDFRTGFRHGYVQRIFASMGQPSPIPGTVRSPIPSATDRGPSRRRSELASAQRDTGRASAAAATASRTERAAHDSPPAATLPSPTARDVADTTLAPADAAFVF